MEITFFYYRRYRHRYAFFPFPKRVQFCHVTHMAGAQRSITMKSSSRQNRLYSRIEDCF